MTKTATTTKPIKRSTSKRTKAASARTSQNGSRPTRKKLTTEEITLRAFRKVYESYHKQTS